MARKILMVWIQALILFLCVHGMKFDASLIESKKVFPCKFCGDNAQVFYELGLKLNNFERFGNIYCDICTVRYIACNWFELDPGASAFYISDVIYEKSKKKQSLEMNNLRKLKIASSIDKNIFQNYLEFDFKDKEERVRQLFKKIQNVMNGQYFPQRKCAICSKMIFNTRKLDCCEKKICFPCFAKEKENCSLCGTLYDEEGSVIQEQTRRGIRQDSQENIIQLLKSVVKQFKNFKYFIYECGLALKYQTTKLECELTEVEAKMGTLIKWKDILSSKQIAKASFTTTITSFEYIARTIILISLFIFINNDFNEFPLQCTGSLFLHNLTIGLCIDWRRDFFNSRLTSAHKNKRLRGAELDFDDLEFYGLSMFFPFFIFFFDLNKNYKFTNPYIFLYLLIFMPFTTMLNVILIHFLTKHFTQKEELKFWSDKI